MAPGLEVLPAISAEQATILSPDALRFLAQLASTFEGSRQALLRRRAEVAAAGGAFGFDPKTQKLREEAWSVAPVPADLRDRRVEITGPVDRKMVINALNSGANVFMADFEDANSPTWDNVVRGQQNLFDAVRRTINFEAPGGKRYALNEKTATLMVRPRGWHLPERNVRLAGQPISGSLFDFGLFFFHNARALLERGTGPYFYLPKLEHHLEAKLWNDVFVLAQESLGLPLGTIKATVLIETLPAAFQMHEILHALREHSAGLNCGRWDYIFSFIKKRQGDPSCVLPDRGQVTMDKGFLRAYSELLIQTCHRRGAHAMGGMAAQIPIKHDPAANERAMANVRKDKLREVKSGHDGTWVAHPGLVAVAKEVFDAHMPGPNQLENAREDVKVTEADLLAPPPGERTEAGLRLNLRVGVQYLAAWLNGQGCVPLYDVMEDAATAEISRAQVWQWLHHQATLDDGSVVTPERFQRAFDEEVEKLRGPHAPPRLEEAAALFARLSTADSFEEFLTLPAYALLSPPQPGAV